SLQAAVAVTERAGSYEPALFRFRFICSLVGLSLPRREIARGFFLRNLQAMNLSQHAEHIAIAVSNKTMITGAVTTGASLAAEKTGFLAVISTPGPEVVNLCA